MKYSLFYDTNALLNLQQKAFEEYFIISQKTLEEIENIKTSAKKDAEVKYKARITARLLDDNYGKYAVVKNDDNIISIVDSFKLDSSSPDNIIIASAYKVNFNTPVIVVSDDVNVKFISREIFGLKTKGVDDLRLVDDEEYTGYKVVDMQDDEMSYFYSNMDDNIYELEINQYLIVKHNGEIVGNYKWNGYEYKHISYSSVSTKYMGLVKPINDEQVLAFDLLQDENTTIKVMSGKAGSGKDFLMIANALKMITDGKYDRLIYIRNSITLADVPDIGALPGDLFEKLAPFTAALADHVGGMDGLMFMMEDGLIQVEHLGFIRGRTFDKAIVLVSEAENMTKDHIQLLISRIGKSSILFINGDYKQLDSAKFRMNNGLMSAISRLKGNPKFGFVKLNKTERSETAKLADLLD